MTKTLADPNHMEAVQDYLIEESIEKAIEGKSNDSEGVGKGTVKHKD